jgi:hypothetical protein
MAGGGSFLPVHIDRIDVLVEPLDSDDAWAHVIVLDEDATAARCDVTIRHEGGAVIAAIHGVELRRVGPSSGLDGLLYELRWVPAKRTASAADSVTAWIVYADGGVGADLADRLRAAGDTCIVATPGETFEQIDDHELRIDGESADEHRALLRHGLDIAGSRPLGIVYAWAAGIEPGDPAAVRAATSDGCAAPIALVQAIGEHFDAVDDPSIADAQPRLWLITRAAQPLALLADDPAAPAAPHQGVLWGLGRVIANERPSLRCTLVDIACTSGGGAPTSGTKR